MIDYTLINNFHFKEEMAVAKLSINYGIQPKSNNIYTGHNYSWNDKYKVLNLENVAVEEDVRFLRIKYKFSEMFPELQVIANKDNHMYNRVYIPTSEKELGSSFYITDERVSDILNLSSEIIKELEVNAEIMINKTVENEKYKPELENDLNNLKFTVTFSKELITTAKAFLLKTKKGIKTKDYYIPLTEYESILKAIPDELNKLYKEE